MFPRPLALSSDLDLAQPDAHSARSVAFRVNSATSALRLIALIPNDHAEALNIPTKPESAQLLSLGASSEREGSVCGLIANSFNYA